MSSLKLGTLQKLDASHESHSIVPFDERFVMGGNGIPYGNMLRGYPDNAIGPQDQFRWSTGRQLNGEIDQ